MKRSTYSEKEQRRLLAALANDTLEHFKRDFPRYAKAQGLEQMREELQSIWRQYQHPATVPELNQPLDFDLNADAYSDKEELEIQARDEHFEEILIEGWLKRQEKPFPLVVEWRPKPRLLANINSLGAMLSLALIRHSERLGFCGNPRCKRPFFFKARKDQRYCSAKCAEPAKREAKFRWHRNNRWEGLWELPRKRNARRKHSTKKGNKK